ncbi:peptidoglycan-binding domain-containing protein [Bosea sp. Root381]|uniref:peptidoglycan-binding domain-containing protein n=1 Tax=Bosea sp. Root381 TaxID=1736524 RepID=UPI0009E68145|nr:peptidoglycan-binding domain-containing protein [Bosea sp. Root381]
MKTRRVQGALLSLGYSLVVDGVAGQKTKTAMQAFQRGCGLAVDGIVGPQTIKAL